jgi:hypothetical protein
MQVSLSQLISGSLKGINSSSKTDLSNQKIQQYSAQSSQAAEYSSSSRRTTAGASLQASRATEGARIASSAVESILDIRKQQKSLAAEAENSSDPTRRAELQSEIDTLDTEIQRVATEALDGSGSEVLNGKTYTLDDTQSVALANLSAIASSSGVDVSTEAGAEAAEDTLDALINTAVSAREASSASTEKAETILAEITSIENLERAKDPESISTQEQAEALATKIAEDLQGLTEGQELSDLDPEIVKSLLAT